MLQKKMLILVKQACENIQEPFLIKSINKAKTQEIQLVMRLFSKPKANTILNSKMLNVFTLKSVTTQ